MTAYRMLGVLFALGACLNTLWAEAPKAEVDWLDRVYADADHHAFTDLIQWKGAYYLCFRSGAAHSSMDGIIRILRSKDMRTWTPSGILKTMGDDRDPHFAATEDRLYVFFGVWDLQHSRDDSPTDRGSIRSHMAASRDGQKWSPVHAIYEPGWWVWRVRHHAGRFYGVAYTAYRPTPSEKETRLLVSDDGIHWEFFSTIWKDRVPTESDFWFNADGSMEVLTRMADKINEAFWFKSDATRKHWEGASVGQIIHSPAVCHWKERIFVSGRGKDEKGWNTGIWELKEGKAIHLLTLPSGGDTSYPGLIPDPESLASGDTPALFVSWYSQHERDTLPEATGHSAAIYTARVTVSP